MGRFGHENGPLWMLAGAVLVLFFLPLGPFWLGPFWFQWAVFDLYWGRFGRFPFLQVSRLYQALILLGLALYLFQHFRVFSLRGAICILGTCEASRFEFESDVPIRFESDGPIRKFRIAAPATFAVVP